MSNSIENFETIIIGAGPGGTTCATRLAQKHVKVALIEQQKFPRFQIGESLLPATMRHFKEIGFFSKIDSGKYIKKYGAQFLDVTTNEEVYVKFSESGDPDLEFSYEVPRNELDNDLLNHAIENGVKVYSPEKVISFNTTPTHIDIITDHGRTLRTQYLLDASGRSSFLGNHFKLRHANKDINNVAVFGHFEGVKRSEGKNEGDITIGIFPGKGWSWFIPFKGNITSVGVVCSTKFVEQPFVPSTFLDQSMEQSPVLIESLKNSKKISEIRSIANYSQTCEKFYGDRWMLVGDAAQFLDPVFSSGLHVSVSSAQFASEAVLQALDKKALFTEHSIGEHYENKFRLGTRRFKGLISLFYDYQFIRQMKKSMGLKNVHKGYTAAIAGDVWNENNPIFRVEAV